MAPSPFSAASGQTGVWTGTEVIVWGADGISADPVGGRYNPETNLWKPISLVDAPGAYVGSMAVWTGSGMLIWQPEIRTGSRYNPVLDKWSSMSSSGAPTIRRESSVVWTGTEMSAGHPQYYWSPVWTGTQLIVRAIYNQQPVTFSYTPPRAAFRVTTVALEGGSVMLTFPSLEGHRYTLWQSDSLAECS